jgi:DNA recombination protein RmuC
MGRFRERVLDLQRHFGQTNQDIEKILTSSEKIAQRGRKIETLEFEENAPAAIEHVNSSAPSPLPSPEPSPGFAPAGQTSPRRGEAAEPRRNGGARVIRQPDLLAKDS